MDLRNGRDGKIRVIRAIRGHFLPAQSEFRDTFAGLDPWSRVDDCSRQKGGRKIRGARLLPTG